MLVGALLTATVIGGILADRERDDEPLPTDDGQTTTTDNETYDFTDDRTDDPTDVETSMTAEPDRRAGVDLAVTWSGIGDAGVSDSVADVEEELATAFDTEVPIPGNDNVGCRLLAAPNEGLAVVTNPNPTGTEVVEAFVITTQTVRHVNGVGVGSTAAEVEAAWPQGTSRYTTASGTTALRVDPGWQTGELSPGQWSRSGPTSTYDPFDPQAPGVNGSLAGFFELDDGGKVSRWRVGAMPYVQHERYCYTP